MTTATMGVEERNTKGFKSDLGDLTVNNQKQLQLLLSAASLPLVQGPSGEMTEWLSAVVKRGDRGSRLAYFNDVCVGAIVFDKAEDSILVEALAVLPAYRSLGLESLMLEHVESLSRSDWSSLPIRIVSPAPALEPILSSHSYNRDGTSTAWIKKLD